MKSKYNYDYLVIGGGSGGIASANRAAIHGARTAIIETSDIGGTCVNRGCVPKKVLWNGANILHQILHFAPDYGMNLNYKSLDYKVLQKNFKNYIQRIHNAYNSGFEKNNVTMINGYGRLVDNHTVSVVDSNNVETIYTSEKILIAPGAYPDIPKEVPGYEFGITSDDFFELTELPKNVTIVGAGYIAVEIAGVLKGLGCEVSLITRNEKPLRWLDNDICEVLVSQMVAQDIKHIPNSKVISVVKNSDESLSISLDSNKTLISDCLIWAIGRVPKTDGLNLEDLGIETDSHGFIITNHLNETTVDNIFAIGDATHMPALTPAAVAAGRRLSERLFNNKINLHFDHKIIPTVIFSHPPVGTIGISEQEALQKFGTYSEQNPEGIKVYKSSFTSMISAITQHRETSFMKLIVQGANEKVIGLHGIGFGVDEMIQGFAVAMSMGAIKSDFDNTLAIHPTGAEEFVTMR